MRQNARRPSYRAGRLLAVAAGAGLLAGAGPITTIQPAITTLSYASQTTRQAAASSRIDPVAYAACSDLKTVEAIAAQEGEAPQGADAYVSGYADASKLGGAAVLGLPAGAFAATTSPGDAVWIANVVPGSTGLTYQCHTGMLHLDYQGQQEFPPVRATFMANGFIPVTATVNITQVPGGPPLTLVEYTNTDGSTPDTTVSTAEVSLRVSDVTVNGVPVNVGPDCRTIRSPYSPDPVADPGNDLLVLTGGSASGDPAPRLLGALAGGGALAGTETIPPFTGCGTGGDNLDPLLDASVSGPGNYLKIVTSEACTWGENTNPVRVSGFGACAANPNPTATDLKPTATPLWTVHGAGSFTSSAPVAIEVGKREVAFTCDSEITGSIGPDPGGFPARDVLGTFALKIGDCSNNTSLNPVSLQAWTQFTATVTGTAGFDLAGTPNPYNEDGRTVHPVNGFTGNLYLDSISSVSINAANPASGQTCSATFTNDGFIQNQLVTPIFTNPSTFHVDASWPGNPGNQLSADCNQGLISSRLFFVNPTPASINITLNATYNLSPGDITITNP